VIVAVGSSGRARAVAVEVASAGSSGGSVIGSVSDGEDVDDEGRLPQPRPKRTRKRININNLK
jgi:hypothetical protein